MRLNRFLLNEDTNEKFFETLAMIGLICKDGPAKIIESYDIKKTTPDEADQIVFIIKNVLEKNVDWDPLGKSEVNRITRYDLNDAVAIIRGIRIFKDKILKKELGSEMDFIHARIKDYYTAEEDGLGKVEGAKPNTADVIIFSGGSINELLKDISLGNAEPDKNLKYIKIGKKIKAFQVSLKKVVGSGSQLGNVKKMTKFLGYTSKKGTEALFKSSEQMEHVNIMLEEGIKEFLKRGWETFKNIINKLLSGFTSKYIKKIKKGPSKSDIDKLFKSIPITEVKVIDKMRSVANNPEYLIGLLISKIKELERLAIGNDSVYISTNIFIPKMEKGDLDMVSWLGSNYLAANLFVDMINDTKKMKATIDRIIAEMSFGGTKLPLWKVYGVYGSGKSYSYLGTLELFMKKDKEIIPNIELLGIEVRRSKKSEHYVFVTLMLDSISENGKKYVDLASRRQKSQSVEYKLEARGYKGPYPLDVPISTILSRVKE